MIETLTKVLNDVDGLLRTAVMVAAIGWVAATWLRSRALVTTISAIIMAGIVVWATSNVSLLRDKVGEDFGGGGGGGASTSQTSTVNQLLGL